ncbi:MAG: hypothetical protein ACWGOY_11295 [Anaerolineales bacterium]
MRLPDFKPIVLDHFSRYPELQIEDLYKLTHQAALGSEHAVNDIESARQWLFRELNQLPAVSPEPLLDYITPDHSIARIHLLPYIAAGGEPENLLQAFVRTANEFQGSFDVLKQYWTSIEALAQGGELPFPPKHLRKMIHQMEASGFPAIHHSIKYVEAYHPGYRVVAPRFLTRKDLNLDRSSK